MENQAKTKKAIMATIILIGLFLIGFYFTNKSRLLAEGDSRDKTNTLKFNLTIDGKKQNFEVDKYTSTNSANGSKYLIVQKNGLKRKELLVDNAGENFQLCSTPMIKIKSGEDIICFQSDSGVHAQSLYLIKYEKDNLLPLKVKMNETDVSITSDVPNITFEDYNKDGYVDIIADLRDYNSDPLKDSFRYYYQNSALGFVFDKEAKP